MSGTGNSIKGVGPSGNQLIDGQLIGTAWAGPTVTYSFPLNASQYTYGSERLTFGPVSSQQQTAARFALDKNDGNGANDGFSLEGFTQENVALTTATNAHVRLGESSAPFTAWAYYPGSFAPSGDVWFGRTFDYRSPEAGNYAWATMLHEIGHAIGLKHGHETIAYGSLPYSKDSMEFSIMTYRSYVGASITSGYQNSVWDFAQTYMMADVAALQWIYGADFTTNNGNTRYSWKPGSGDTWVDGTRAIDAGGSKIFATVWDGGGIDTYDLSAYATALSIDLAPGGHSVFASSQIAHLGLGNYARGSIFNALQYQGDPRSLIENAIGGSGNDTIKGNAADNDLEGRGGSDRLFGLNNDDALSGGSGSDRMYGGNGDDSLNGAQQIDQSLFGGSGDDRLSSGAGLDRRLYGDSGADGLFGGAGKDSLAYGGDGDDRLFGGSGSDFGFYGDEGDDRLDGKRGHDTLFRGDAGDDTLFGDDGDDVSFWGGGGDDRIFGGAGSDNWLNGNNGADLIYGDAAADSLIGAAGADSLFGGLANDRLHGVAGEDALFGGNSVDRLFGGSGRDTLAGGSSNDILRGGSGADWFMLASGTDSIADFSGRQFGATSEKDRFVFSSGQESGLFAYRGAQGFSGSGDSEARFANGQVKVDRDGDGASDLTVKVTGLTQADQLTASDFLWL
ncbi:MAG: M10 family metallopeptidase [Kiloniellales bacterium]